MNEIFPHGISISNTLTRENYGKWLKETNLLASTNGVKEYIHQEKIKILEKSKISREELKKKKKKKKKKKNKKYKKNF